MGQKIPFVTSTIGPVTFGFLVGMIPVAGYFISLVRKATPEEKPGLAALIPVYVAGGAFFMVLHLSGGLMTVFAENNTDRQAEWIPSWAEFYAQKAMPSYFTNAGPDLPRPDERTLFVVPDETESMFGARILSEAAGRPDPCRPFPGVTVHDYTGQEDLDGSLRLQGLPRRQRGHQRGPGRPRGRHDHGPKIEPERPRPRARWR